jgi:predicted small secreted protein
MWLPYLAHCLRGQGVITMTKVAALSLVAILALAACNTMQGMGKDVSDTGDALTNTAADTEKKM